METEAIETIAGYIALATPVTVAFANLAKIGIEWLKQTHSIREAQTKQAHQITTHYLDRALDPNVPLAIRHQLLRFLATPDKNGSRLSEWAGSELSRIGGIVEETNRAVVAAESELQHAKNAAEVAFAERKLADAIKKQRSLLEPPLNPPITAAAIRAGFVYEKELSGLNMNGQNLSGAQFVYRNLRGADFSGADLSNACLQGCDLRAVNFSGATLKGTVLCLADIRGADFSEATIDNADFQQARLEGANMSSTTITDSDMRATYDANTIWPDGFDPEKQGAVHVAPVNDAEQNASPDAA